MGAPKAVLLLCAFLPLAHLAVAQSVAGTIRGTVFDPHTSPVPGASVRAVDEASGVARTVESDALGNYEASQLRPGSYRIEVTASGFKAHSRSGVILKAASTIRLDVQLELGALHEQITVKAEGQGNIAVDSPALALGTDQQQVRDLPRGSRDIQDFLVLSPNVVGGHEGLQFLGGRSYGVAYIQDGQPSSGLIFGNVGSAAPGLDAVAELQVLSNSYAAEYGGLAGVVVTTRRGASAYHGGGFYDLGADELNALSSGNIIPADRIEPAAHAINDLFYPLPNQGTLPNGFGVFQQFVPLDRRRDRADLRVDHELSSRDSLLARASWQRRDPDAFTFEAGSALTHLGILDRRVQALTVVAGWTRLFSGAGAVNELRVGYNLHDGRRRSRFVAGPVADQLGLEVPAGAREARGFPTFNFSGANRPTNVQDQRVNAFRDLREATLSTSDSLSMVAGRHSLKLGASLTRNAARDGYSTGIPSRVREQRNTRLDNPLDATSLDFAWFV